MVMGPEGRRLDRRWLLGSLFALGAALSYAGATVIAKRIMKEELVPPLVVTAFSMLFGSVAMVAIAGRDMRTTFRPPKRYLGIILVAGLCSGGAVAALYFALHDAPLVVVTPIVSTNPLVTLLLVHLFLRGLEKITWRVAVGTLLTVGGVILVILGRPE